MFDEDNLFNIDGDMPGSGANGSYRDEAMENFYNKLGEYNSNWMDLEGLSYKCQRTGRFRFEKQVQQMSETPDL